MKAKKKWTNSLTVRILHTKGLTVNEIAKEMNVSKKYVLDVLKNTGLKPKYELEKRQPHSWVNACKKVKI